MPFATFLLAVSAALVVSLLLMRPIRQLAFRRGYVDRPDEKRRVHTKITPNIGGLGIVAGIVVGGVILAVGHADASWLHPPAVVAP